MQRKRFEELRLQVNAKSEDAKSKYGAVLFWLATLFATVASAPLAVRAIIAVALLVCTALLDLASGSEISFSIFYLVPVSFAGAYISHRAGLVFAIASAVIWGYIEIATGSGYSAAWIPYWNSLVRLVFFVLVNELIDQLKLAHAGQRAMAREDSLTGIANSRMFREHIYHAIAYSRRTGRPFTVAYIDLDRFKQVNDKFGHAEGDKLLQTVAQLMAVGLRSTDVVARLGGDEFGILMPETRTQQARISLERITSAIDDVVGGRWAVGATVGAVTFNKPPKGVEQVVQEADTLMYRGKSEGRGSIIQACWPS